jgi:hypothetical protein
LFAWERRPDQLCKWQLCHQGQQKQINSTSKTPIPNTKGWKMANKLWTQGQCWKDKNSYLPQNRYSNLKH